MAGLRTGVKRLIHAAPPVARQVYRLRHGPFGACLADAWSIPSWLGDQEALALASASYSLPLDAVVVEIGSFLGKSAILLAGARKLRGSGRVHCVDPFDGSGDAFSVPVYRSIENSERRSLRERFDANIARAGLNRWVQVHVGTAASIAAGWSGPIDMLFLDGDQSPEGASLAYEMWRGHLRVGGIIALHNSSSGEYTPGHEGLRLLAVHAVKPPEYGDIRSVDTTTFARKLT